MTISPERILVTGGAGFIGSNVVRLLRQRYPEAAVRVMHQPRENLINLRGVDGIELMPGDVTRPDQVAAAVAGCDVVFHLAAIYALWLPDMSLMHRVNVDGTRNVLTACREAGVRRVVYTSSAVCFAGQGLDVRSTETSPFVMDGMVYAVSKHDSHQIAEEFARDGLDVVIVCPCGPVGPGDIGPTPTGRMITSIFDFPITLSARSEVNFIDVRDCAMGHVLALEKGRTGESYLLGGENYTYSDMLRRVLRLCGLKRRVFELPTGGLMPIARVLLKIADRTGKAPLLTPAEVELTRIGLVCDAAKARRELGLTVRPLEESLQDALIWFVAHGHITDARVVARFAGQAKALRDASPVGEMREHAA